MEKDFHFQRKYIGYSPRIKTEVRLTPSESVGRGRFDRQGNKLTFLCYIDRNCAGVNTEKEIQRCVIKKLYN